MTQTHGQHAAAVRAGGAARARRQAEVQAPSAKRHLHQPRRPGCHGDRPAARRADPTRIGQSRRRHAQGDGQRDRVAQETSKGPDERSNWTSEVESRQRRRYFVYYDSIRIVPFGAFVRGRLKTQPADPDAN